MLQKVREPQASIVHFSSSEYLLINATPPPCFCTFLMRLDYEYCFHSPKNNDHLICLLNSNASGATILYTEELF